MNQMIVLQKDDDGYIQCWNITKKGAATLQALHNKVEAFDNWEGPNSVTMDDIEDILNRTTDFENQKELD